MSPHAPLRLEDASEDILAKAMAGQGISVQALAETAGLSVHGVEALLRGGGPGDALQKAALVLGLHGPSLQAIAEGRWHPNVEAPVDILCWTTPFPVSGYPEMTVNAYACVDEATGSVILVDTGTTAAGLINDLAERGLEVRAIFLTHAHRDHVGGLEALRRAWPEAPVWIDRREWFPGAQPIEVDGPRLVGPFVVESRPTPGHSAGGRTYVVQSAGRLLAFVGDALFAGSMGGAANHYGSARAAIERQILSLPEDTLLCPGHGPLTTVGLERGHNPFFARSL